MFAEMPVLTRNRWTVSNKQVSHICFCHHTELVLLPVKRVDEVFVHMQENNELHLTPLLSRAQTVITQHNHNHVTCKKGEQLH